MLGFSKNKKQEINETINAQEFFDSKNDSNSSEEEIETQLSIPDDWDITNEERYVYAFHNNESPNLKANQISIYGMELFQEKDTIIVTGLVRNTVPKNIRFAPTSVFLLGADGEVLAKKVFDLSKLELLPSLGARPWNFEFGQNDLLKHKEFPQHNWSLEFETNKKHLLDLPESWKKTVAEETKVGLGKIMEITAPLKPGEITLMGLEAKQNDHGDLNVTILIRNGSDNNINLNQIPLGFMDASGVEIARGGFKLNNFMVCANTSKPWTFVFPASTIKQNSLDLNRWKVYPFR